MSNKNNTNWLINKSKFLFGDSFDYSRSVYIDAKTKIDFKCIKHNKWFSQTSNNHFKSQHPCPFCLKDFKSELFSPEFSVFKIKIDEIFNSGFSYEHTKYINQRTPIKLRCIKHNLIVEKSPQVFLRGHGCSKCAKELITNNHSELKLAEIKTFVKKLNGHCYSNEYLNNKSKLLFECQFGHRFENSWSAVKNSLRWCPKCSSNKLIGESLARLILEHFLKMELPSAFINEMEGLQLDGFNELNKIAFEYQGYQHFTKGSHFHGDINQYHAQLKRDDLKKTLCSKYGITLIEIFEFQTIRLGRIDLFVEQVKEKLNELKIPFDHTPFELDLVELYRGKKLSLIHI